MLQINDRKSSGHVNFYLLTMSAVLVVQVLCSSGPVTAYLEERLVGVMSGTDDGTAIDADAGAWDDVGARLLGEELAARPGGPMAGAGGGRTLPAAVANARERARQQGGGRKPRDGWVDIDL